MPEPTTARNEALSPAAVRVLEQTRLAHVLHFCLLSPCHCDGRHRGANVPRHASPLAAQLWTEAFTPRGSQAPRPSTSPPPEAYHAWLA